jgi:magnesium chelatase subunit I
VRQASELPPLRGLAQKLGATDAATTASAVEFVLEGLHLSKKLNKDTQAGAARYRR